MADVLIRGGPPRDRVTRRRRTRWKVLVAGGVVASLCSAFVVPAGAVVEPPPGAAEPTPGSGIGTSAALNSPRCTTGEQYGVYGRFDSTMVGGGPICVKPWKQGDDNGGATASGVTRTSVKVVAVVPNEQQINSPGGTAPVNRADNSRGVYQDAVHDYLHAVMPTYETWGRDIEVRFLVSGGNDETAQRADAVAITAERPFAVINLVPAGLDVLDAEMANAKILVFGYSTTTKKALAQAPFRWGLADAQATAVNTAEVVGKQLASKKAQFAGSDAIKAQRRTFGTVYIENLIDIAQYTRDFEGFGGSLAVESSYQATGSPRGDPATAQQQVPVILTKLKEAGVTTVILFTDVAMTNALMLEATKQEWYPEWFLTGTVYHDLALLARQYPPEQAAHAFGISTVSPWVLPDPTPAPPAKSLTVLTDPLNWYWGENAGTSASATPQFVAWLLGGIHTAGPKLTPRTFQQGLFSVPASGGAAQGYPTGAMTGYGKNAGLPYDEYLAAGIDFAPIWWDPETSGPSPGTGSEGQGIAWYVDEATRYKSGDWPKQQFAWFDEKDAVYEFQTRQTPDAGVRR